MEKFDDEFGDLSGYKILSFEEVSKGFEGNKNLLLFEKNVSENTLSPFGKNSIFYNAPKENFELTRKHRIINGISKK